MKKSNSFLMLFCIGIFAVITVCAQKASVGHQQIQGFIIHGEIQGITNGMVYLKYTENKKEIKDSTSLAAGKFTFTGNVTEPVFSVISTNNRKTYIGLFVENNAITITADTLGKRIITGSPTQDIY